jgi:hypothetical protein
MFHLSSGLILFTGKGLTIIDTCGDRGSFDIDVENLITEKIASRGK